MDSACNASIKPATKQEIPFALSLLNGVVRESDQMESLKPSRDVTMSTADTPERRLGGDGDAERVEKLATCVAPTARSSRGGFRWRGRFLLVRQVSVGAATPVCTRAFCRSDASREPFGLALPSSSKHIRRDAAGYVGAVKAKMVGIISECREKKEEGGCLMRFFRRQGCLGDNGAVGRVEGLATCVAPAA